jgi:hypothetical protein
MAAATKVAAFGAMLRIFYVSFAEAYWQWRPAIIAIALITMVFGSLVAISVIELLKDFIELAGEDHVGGGTKWRIVIHLTFVASGVLFAAMDWIADKREFHGTHK